MNQDKLNMLKRAIRRKIFSGSLLLKENNKKGLFIIPSKKYPTEIVNIKGTKYIRINEKDINKDIDNLLSMMLGMDEPYKENIEEELKKSYKLNKELDGIELNIPENIKDLPLTLRSIEEKKEKKKEKVRKDDSDDLFEKEIKDELESCDVIRKAKESFDTILDKSLKSDLKLNDESREKTGEVSLESIDQFDISKSKIDSPFVTDISKSLKDKLKYANKLAKSLIKALKGRDGKSKSINPTKRISSRDVILDRDKIYITKKLNQGKKIEMNLLIDMSGSMRGEPIKNATLIVYIFNQLAKQGLVQGHVLYSSSYNREYITLPVKDEEILARTSVQGDEGLKSTLDEYKDIVKGHNIICITDGNIVDVPIDTRYWQKNKIHSTGVYVANLNVKELLEYGKNLHRWFNTGIVRPTIEDLIQTLIRIGLK